MRNFSLGCAAGAIAVAMVATAPAMAQETTSAIHGIVTDGGAPVADANVVILHTPSGTRQTLTTNANGEFNATGLRVGGPFNVIVTAAGKPSSTVTDIYTVVTQAYELPVDLSGSASGPEIVVSASKLPGAKTLSQGPATVLNAEQIANVATVNRDVRDLMRRDPFARLDYAEGSGRAVSFAGQNSRFNRFSIDGVPVTDNFGLNPDGLPTRRSPVPLDAIGQFQTKVAPYDVREGNFQGGAINAILKSGGNEFHGTAFYAYSSDELSGKKTKAGPGVPTGRVSLPNFTYKNFGAEISGPIIKDRLFFMVAGERIRAGTPIPEGTPGSNAGTVIPLITDAQVTQVQQIAKSRYNYETGGVLSNSNDRDDRLVAKLDANLSETQRASITYMYTKDSIQFNQNTFTTGTPGIGLASNGYISSNRLHTGVAQLNSDWSDEFSTEIRGFYKDYKRGQDPVMGRGFAQMRICAAPTSDRASGTGTATDLSTACQPGFGVVSIGPDASRQSNALTSQTWGGLVQARLDKDGHSIRVFGDVQHTKIFNLFVQRTAGDYYFDSLADFQAGNAQRLQYTNAVPSVNPADGAAKFSYFAYSVGIQDNWRVSDTLKLTYGARYDMYGGDSRPARNVNFANRYGFTNAAYISGRGILQPRFGFDYKPFDRISFRGGVGIFSGGSPDVYVSNSFSNTGFLTNTIDIRQQNNGAYTGTALPAGVGAAALTGVTGTSIPTSVNGYLTSGTASATATTNALDPNFKLPSQWRATLSTDYDLDLGDTLGDWQLGADLFYSKVRNQVFFTDLRSVPTASRTPDGRVRYTSATTFADTNQDLFLTNTKKGRSYIGVLRLDKRWDFGLSHGVSFTYQDVKDQAPATSSTASSNYGNGGFLDPNGAAYGVSNDETRYAIKYNVSYEHAFFGDNKTTIALFGETRSGRPFSWTMNDIATGRSGIFGTTGSASRYLLYVPTVNDPLVSYDSAATRAYLENLINTTDLKKYRGKIAPRNKFNSRWFTRIDLHLAQEIPTGLGDSKVTLFADVENFTNMLNKNWGQIREYPFAYVIPAVRAQCLQTAVATGTTPTAAQQTSSTSQVCAQYRYSQPNATPSTTISSRQSLYQIRVGARFTF
ncbi:TonB-dependent receptor [Sphingomonas montanisoli]|uniref:TonB-dependent receptor plug domain-containing protein n=1 Tax=Sphingomonas montanisoli TaxID=2606412 RepID=A0A5D9C8F8_9SPHN|nr:TonB-dependent receptor [Sphingomonas montanisoli]TZG27422.1 TonB-dependent receptor plug domain-containing protein [Sphingomonas montanisoli]